MNPVLREIIRDLGVEIVRGVVVSIGMSGKSFNVSVVAVVLDVDGYVDNISVVIVDGVVDEDVVEDVDVDKESVLDISKL